MNKSREAVTIATLGCMVAGCALGADYGLVDNGGFEQGSGFGLTGAAVPGWSVTAGSVDLVKEPYWNDAEGSAGVQSLDLSGNVPGKIEQAINVTTGGKYIFSFWYAGNFEISSGAGDEREFDFGLGSVVTGTFKFVSTGGSYQNLNYLQYSKEVWLNPGILNLSFLSKNLAGDDPRCGPVIDGVSLAAVPEPYHYGLASVLGLMGLVVADRMRHRKLVS